MLPTLDRSRSLRVAALCGLYVGQGIPQGFVAQGLKTYLIDQGVSTEQVGFVLSMISLPWAIKWCWGPLLDRFQGSRMGRRRPWVLVAQTGMIGSLLAITLAVEWAAGGEGPLGQGTLRALIWLVLLVNIFASLQDVAVDATAIDILPESERGVANGFMYGSAYFGSFLGAAVVGAALIQFGVPAACLLQIVFMGLIVLIPLLIRERRGDALISLRAAGESDRPAAAGSTSRLIVGLLRAFSVRTSLLCVGLAATSQIASNAHLLLWAAHAQNALGWSAPQYLTMDGGVSVWFGLGGSLLGGVIASAVGAKRAAIGALTLMAGCLLAFGLLSHLWDQRPVVWALFLTTTLAAGLTNVSLFALFMGACWPPVAATQFTAYMAMLNLSIALGSVVAGQLGNVLEAGLIELPTVYTLLAALQAGTLLLVAGADPGEVRRKLGDGATTGPAAGPAG